MSERVVLITGAGGLVGSRIADVLAQNPDHHLLLWLHAASDADFAQRRGMLRERFIAHADRIDFAWGDLASHEPFAGVNPERITGIVHCAAVTRFNVDAQAADAVNIEGTRRMCEFAARCKHLERFLLLGSVYGCGLVEGEIAERPFAAAPEFANHYERSKHAAERVLREEFPQLPWRILRMATAIADDDSGGVTQYNAFHNTLKLCFYGLLSLIPGNENAKLHFVTADFAASAAARVFDSATAHGIYHACHEADYALTLGELMDIAFERFNEEEDFRKRRILKPLYCDEQAFGLLSSGVKTFGGAIVDQGLSSVTPFAKQLYSMKTFSSTRLRELWPEYTSPNPAVLARAVCDFLVATRWGLRAGS